MQQLSLAEIAQQKQFAVQIVEHVAKLLINPFSGFHREISRLGAFLQACETKLIKLMDGLHPTENEPGITQYGLVLWVLDTTHPYFSKALGLPQTQITLATLQQWEAQILSGGGVDDYEGSLIELGPYEQLDPKWVGALFYYVSLKAGFSPWAPFGKTPATLTTTGDVKIALVGDWGTGNWTDGTIQCPALAVMDQVKNLAPDYTIHLGDVYYAGTANPVSDEEVDNFVNYWVPGSAGSFMLNSNHEMYSGAQGYFGKGLAAPPFAAQQGTSYFAIQGAKWIIIGLDTAYYDPSPLFLNGNLADVDQINFIKGLDTTNKKVIVLTHHNGTNIEGTAALPLWNEVTSALGKAPEFWYWGHVHNGIVYSDQSFPAQNGTNARCAGHGAIPFGVGFGLSGKPSIEYFSNELLSSAYPDTDPRQSKRVLNGFATLRITDDSINEDFIDQTGVVRWSKTTPI
jgi:Calcineurin-like phosphoesterase